MKLYCITIYTSGGAVEYIVPATCESFDSRMASALANGDILLLDTVEGGKLVLNPLQSVAIEIAEIPAKDERMETPPTQKSDYPKTGTADKTRL